MGVCWGGPSSLHVSGVYVNKQERFRMSPDPLPHPQLSKGYCLSLQDCSNKPLHTEWLRLGSCKSKAKISNVDLEAPDGECAPYLLPSLC